MVARKNAESVERPKAKAPDIFSHPAIDRRSAVGGINRGHKNMQCACSNYRNVRLGCVEQCVAEIVDAHADRLAPALEVDPAVTRLDPSTSFRRCAKPSMRTL